MNRIEKYSFHFYTCTQFQRKWDEDPKMEFLFYGFLRAFRDPWRSPHKWPHRPNVTLVQTWRTCKDNKSSWPLVLLCKSATIICLTARPASRRRDLEITNYVARLMIILLYIYIYIYSLLYNNTFETIIHWYRRGIHGHEHFYIFFPNPLIFKNKNLCSFSNIFKYFSSKQYISQSWTSRYQGYEYILY